MTKYIVEIYYWDDYGDPKYIYETHFYDNGEVFDMYDRNWKYNNDYERDASATIKKVFLTRIIQNWSNTSALHLVICTPHIREHYDDDKVVII